jgi:hypothetical protein
VRPVTLGQRPVLPPLRRTPGAVRLTERQLAGASDFFEAAPESPEGADSLDDELLAEEEDEDVGLDVEAFVPVPVPVRESVV